MSFLKEFDGYTVVMIFGALLIAGSFVSIRSGSVSKFDQDLALFLLIGGTICIGIGMKVVNMAAILGPVTQYISHLTGA